MAKFIITNKAVEDLSKTWNYTYEFWSENQADKYYNELLKSCQIIAENQNFGRKYDEISADIYGYKFGAHIIFYRKMSVVEIEITRILHSRMDLKNRIQE